MFFFGILLLAGASCFQQQSSLQDCSDRDAFRCTNGECVPRFVWCDSVKDCSDGSDEDFCYGATCLDSHFRCENGGCIPVSGVCDSYSDCTDGSDEKGCADKFKVDTKRLFRSKSGAAPTKPTTKAVADAAAYLLSKLTDETGWGNFTPRAIVALSFADRASPISKEEKELMIKTLNVQLMADLIHKKDQTALSSLALYINALYATCQDPRNFRNQDLVARLRSDTDIAMKSDFAFPVALLTLCIANHTKSGDIYKLSEMYSSSDKTGFKALVIMAMVCIARKTNHRIEYLLNDFYNTNDRFIKNADIYTKALYYQATSAAGFNTNGELQNYQYTDGSFGDMLATYSAIPALLNTSLLDLRCNATKHEETAVANQLKGNGKEIIYTLWMPSNTGTNTHSMVVIIEGNKTFYDVMKMAAVRDPLYSFLYDQTNEGKIVYSLAGIPNDPETGTSWTLHVGNAGTVSAEHLADAVRYLKEKKLGVDMIFPKDQDHFVYWLKR